VRLGKPADYDDGEYKQLDIDGILVYRHNSMDRLSDTMNIDIDIHGESLSTRLVMRGLPRESHSYC
jgi:hypothetical protein